VLILLAIGKALHWDGTRSVNFRQAPSIAAPQCCSATAQDVRRPASPRTIRLAKVICWKKDNC